ncbi:MAG: RHS repeat domain-containing protein, partial [Pyrinomonadaceae bacterium]
IQYNVAPDEDHVTMTGFGGSQLTWVVKWKSISVQKGYTTTAAESRKKGGTSNQTVNEQFRVVDRIILPSQVGSQYYEFDYNSEPGGANGWGEVSKVRMPSGATAEYEYTTPLPNNTGKVLINFPSKKTLKYQAEYDGASNEVTEVTNYSIGETVSTITAPDGSFTTEYHGNSSYQNVKSGLVYKTVHSNGNVTEKLWAYNRPTGANLNANINAYVKTEFTTIANSSGNPALIAIKDYTLDPNGNQTEVKEYDWIVYSPTALPRDGQGNPTGIPAGAVLKRRTVSTYLNSATGNPNNAYWAGSAPNVRNAVSAVEVQNGSLSSVSRSEFYYDNPATTANVTLTKVWDSFKDGVSRPYSNPLTSTNSISTSTIYNACGMPTSSRDAKNIETTITYDGIGGNCGLYAITTITAANTSVARTSAATYDFYTGLTTSATDVDNGNATTATNYDALGRPISVTAPNGATSTMTYNDIDRYVVTRSDVQGIGDQKKVSTTFYDQLGRVRLAKTLEDAAAQSETNETDGIKVQTRYMTGNPNSFQVTSNPYRADYSYNAFGEDSMGWTLSQTHNSGRQSYVTTYGGHMLPSPWGGNGNSTGTVSTTIDANPSGTDRGTVTTVTDQASKQRRSITNVLGQLIRVDEPTAGGLGPVTSPNQPTSYSYDTLGNMITVQQGVQYRHFLYSSLGRLLRVRQPEQDMNANLALGGLHPTNSSWTAGFTYDANGNVLTTTDAKNVTITNNSYDALNRPASRSYSDGVTPAVFFAYDQFANSKGKLTNVNNGISESRYTQFDVVGRLLQYQQLTHGQTYTSSYQYNISGALTYETYPSGRIVNNEFESDGDLALVESQKFGASVFKTYVSDFSYNAAGGINHMKLGNGKWESAKFNTLNQITELGLGSSATDTSIWKTNYEYGELQTNGTVDTLKNAGNIARQTLTIPGSTFIQSYNYDSLDRLTQAKETMVGGSQNWIQNFGYDLYGNRTSFSQNIGGNTTATNPSINPNTNRFNTGQGFVYDANGNVIQDVDPVTGHSRQFVFNADNKQTQVTDLNTSTTKGTYLYDGEGKRVKKITETETTVFVYSAGKLVAEYSTNVAPPAEAKTAYTTTDHLAVQG